MMLINIEIRILQLTHNKCFDIVKMSVLEKFVDGWPVGMWKITGLAFSHTTRASFCDNGKNWPPLFAPAHICMNELMLIDDD